MYRLLRPLLFLLDPEKAHNLLLKLLPYIIRKNKAIKATDPINLFNLTFPNPIGLAAGCDKNGDYIDQLLSLGFGFLEVGTVTPLPQPGNAKPRLFRSTRSHAVINRMGFNNKGVDYLVERLKSRQALGIVGVNIGKNKDTPNEQAHNDYLICLNKVYSYADYIVINISSPNTPGLRDLQSPDSLEFLLSELNSARDKLKNTHLKIVPLLVKISPDFSKNDLPSFLEALRRHKIDGIIATNTTLSRDGVVDLPFALESGGLSGAPLKSRSTDMIRAIKDIVGDALPIIGVGGIDSPDAAHEKCVAGAKLLQVYTGLVFRGPGLIKKLLIVK